MGAAIVSAGITILVYTAATAPTSRPASIGAGPAPAVVQIMTAAYTPVVITTSHDGTIIPTPDLSIAPQEAGWVRAIGVKQGQRVRRGEVVVLLEPAEDAADRAENAYNAARQDLNATQEALSNAQDRLVTAESTAATTEARLADARAELTASQNLERQARTELSSAIQTLQDQTTALQQSRELFQQGIISNNDLQQAQNAQSQAASGLNDARTALSNAQSDSRASSERVTTTQQALTRATASVTSARAAVKSAQENVNEQQRIVNQAEAKWHLARRREEGIYLRTPAAGIVTAVFVKLGDMATAGTVVVSVKRTGVATVVFEAADDVVASLKSGAQAVVYPPLQIFKRMEALIARTVDISERAADRYRVTLEVQDIEARLTPETLVTVQVPVREVEAVAVPRTATVVLRENLAVWLVVNRTAHLQPVTNAGFEGDNAIITKGLNQGDSIITWSDRSLREGLPVVVNAQR